MHIVKLKLLHTESRAVHNNDPNMLFQCAIVVQLFQLCKCYSVTSPNTQGTDVKSPEHGLQIFIYRWYHAHVYLAPRSYSTLGNTRMLNNKLTKVSCMFQLFIHATKITNFGSQQHNFFVELTVKTEMLLWQEVCCFSWMLYTKMLLLVSYKWSYTVL